MKPVALVQVFDMVKSDIGTRKKDRVVRIEIGPRGAVSIACINDLEKQMADALKLTFSARQAAYDDAVILLHISLARLNDCTLLMLSAHHIKVRQAGQPRPQHIVDNASIQRDTTSRFSLIQCISPQSALNLGEGS